MNFKVMKESISCGICFEDFNDESRCPRILSCGHTFCHTCLHKLFSEDSLCPTCKTSFNYTSVELIPANFLAKSLLSIKKELPVTKLSTSNLEEESSSEPPIKKMRCLDCSAWACSHSEGLIHEHCQTVHTAEDCEDIKLKVFEKVYLERSLRESTMKTLDVILKDLNENANSLKVMNLRENEFLEKLQQYLSSVEKSADDDSFISAMAKLELFLSSGQKIHLMCLPEAADIKKQILMTLCSKEACCLVINQGTDDARYGKLAVVDNKIRIYSFQLEKPPKVRFIPINHIFPAYPDCPQLSKKVFFVFDAGFPNTRKFDVVMKITGNFDEASSFAAFFNTNVLKRKTFWCNRNSRLYELSLQSTNFNIPNVEGSFQTPFNSGASIGRWEMRHGLNGVKTLFQIAWTSSPQWGLGFVLTGQDDLTICSNRNLLENEHGWVM